MYNRIERKQAGWGEFDHLDRPFLFVGEGGRHIKEIAHGQNDPFATFGKDIDFNEFNMEDIPY